MRVIHLAITGTDGSSDLPIMLVTEKNYSTMTQGKLARKKWLKGPESQDWKEAEFSQLDTQDSYGMYGQPCKRFAVPKGAKIVCLV